MKINRKMSDINDGQEVVVAVEVEVEAEVVVEVEIGVTDKIAGKETIVAGLLFNLFEMVYLIQLI